MIVEFCVSSSSEFKFEPRHFDAECPETFTPKVGDRIWVDYPGPGSALGSDTIVAHMYITESEWHVLLTRDPKGGPMTRTMGMRITLASEMPDTPKPAARGKK